MTTSSAGVGGYQKQRKKVLKDIHRLNELIIAEKVELPKFDLAQISHKAIAQIHDENDDEEALMLLFV